MFKGDKNKLQFIIFLLALFSFSLYSIFPVLKYFFLFTLGISLVLKTIEFGKTKTRTNPLLYLWNYKLLFIIIFLHLIAVYRTDGHQTFLFKEVSRYVFVLTLLFLIPLQFIETFSQKSSFYLKIILYSIVGICLLHLFILATSIFFPIVKGFISPFGIDKNILSYYCIIALGIAFYLNKLNELKPNQFLSVLFFLSIIIVFTFSRRGLVVFLVLYIFAIFYYIKVKNIPNKRTISQYFIITLGLIIIVSSTISLRRLFIHDTCKKEQFSQMLYPIYILVNPEIRYHEFVGLLWKDDYGKRPSENDLIYNGDFSMGKTYWGMFLNTGELGGFEILEDNYGKFARITRKSGRGNFQLCYLGPIVNYYAKVNYTFSYNYRVIEGDSLPFSIGWNVKDGIGMPISLRQNITKMDNGWYKGEANYTFKEDHIGEFYTFMNSLKPGSVVDFKNIRLFSSDTLKGPLFNDSNGPINNFIAPRTDRWNFALYNFNKSSFFEKIFGSGFNYLKIFQKRFHGLNSETIDYPHNPFLSALLYSGILGLLIYCWFVIRSFMLYLKYYNQLFLLLFFYSIGFIFVFFSGNSHFSVPVFIILSFIPFYYKNQKEKFES